MNQQRIPPQNLDAEKAVLGACIADSSLIPEIVAVITTADFYLPSHQKTFAAILTLFNEGKFIDVITVDNVLKSEPAQRPSAADLCAMVEFAFPSHAVEHARLVKDSALRRHIIESVRAAIDEEVYDPNQDPASIASKLIASLSSNRDWYSVKFPHISEATSSALKDIRASYHNDSRTWIPTGLRDVDIRIGGIPRGRLTVIAGRPSMGKTAWAATAVLNAAKKGHRVAFITIESPKEAIITRMLSTMTGIENRNIQRGRLTEAEMAQVVVASEELSKLPIWIRDAQRSWERIKLLIHGLKLAQPELEFVVLDYCQLIEAPAESRHDRRDLEIGRISGGAKALALGMGIAVVLLSQLNREVEKQSNKRPKLSDMRDSGNLEQDADIVALLYRPVYYDENKPRDFCEFIVSKNRDGAVGSIKLRFDEKTVSFSDWIEPSQAQNEHTSARAGARSCRLGQV